MEIIAIIFFLCCLAVSKIREEWRLARYDTIRENLMNSHNFNEARQKELKEWLNNPEQYDKELKQIKRKLIDNGITHSIREFHLEHDGFGQWWKDDKYHNGKENVMRDIAKVEGWDYYNPTLFNLEVNNAIHK